MPFPYPFLMKQLPEKLLLNLSEDLEELSEMESARLFQSGSVQFRRRNLKQRKVKNPESIRPNVFKPE